MKVGKFKHRLSATLPGLLSLAVSIQAGLAVAQQLTAKQTYVYKTAKGLDIKADVYRPATDQVTPAMMWIHGGALIFGERSWIMAYQLERYLAAGYTVVSIDSEAIHNRECICETSLDSLRNQATAPTT